jgi:hypothetical protein
VSNASAETQLKQTAQMITSLKRGSKVFELLKGGAAARKPGRRRINVFARWAILLVADFL